MLTGNALMALIVACTSSGFLLIGYDNGVMGGLVNNAPFLTSFNLDAKKNATAIGTIVAIYEYVFERTPAPHSNALQDRLLLRIRSISFLCRQTRSTQVDPLWCSMDDRRSRTSGRRTQSGHAHRGTNCLRSRHGRHQQQRKIDPSHNHGLILILHRCQSSRVKCRRRNPEES